MKTLKIFFLGITLTALSTSGCVSQNDVDNMEEQILITTAALALDPSLRISVQVNANSLNSQGVANLNVYSGSTCTGTALFSENNVTSSKTFLLPDAGTYSVRASFGASNVCSSTPVVLSASKRTSACSVNLTTVDCL
ncbi:hypothetical protein [Leptospira adleri]|uniref:hypothetical protein n=1 Tax=Leptospira adleri TaxID=2023186 RepID=UPI00108320BC|nr:hypothetical protein [Leptospira adleri]TGM53296.1 hypothetical protein EHQ97_15530 [Leptospira adleri]